MDTALIILLMQLAMRKLVHVRPTRNAFHYRIEGGYTRDWFGTVSQGMGCSPVERHLTAVE
jgi:hypothetical protein